jgi:hypothetical protein
MDGISALGELALGEFPGVFPSPIPSPPDVEGPSFMVERAWVRHEDTPRYIYSDRSGMN